MRKHILGALLSLSAILPGLASAQDVPDQRDRRPERSGEARGHWRQQQVSGDERVERGRRDGGGRPEIRQDAQLPPVTAAPAYADRQHWNRQDASGRGNDRAAQNFGQRDDRSPGWTNGRDGRQDRYRDGRDRQDVDRSQFDRRDQARRDDRGRQWNRDRDDRHDGYRDDRRFDDRRFDVGRRDDRRDWNRGWRQDRRYDWSGYRSANRNAYRLPRYYAPYGSSYGYRRFGIGVTLSGGLFGQNYWIDDPYDYRLPPAYGPYRWVRYYDDALLVDVRTGTIVDTVYDIFY